MEALCPYYWFVPKRVRPNEEVDQLELTELMKRETEKLHDVSDKLVLLKLTSAFTSKQAFGHALLLFYIVFKEIDDLLRIHGKEEIRLGPLQPYIEDLLTSRMVAFQQDIAFYLGEGWEDQVEVTRKENEALKMYQKHLQRLEPLLVVPYFYHQTLALLAGGQTIRKLVLKAFAKDASTCLFDFPDLKQERWKLKQDFKEEINRLKFHSDKEKTAFLLESGNCFRFNNHVIKSFQQVNWLMVMCKSVWFHVFVIVLVIVLTFLYL